MESSVKAQQWLIGIFSVLLIVILIMIAGVEMKSSMEEKPHIEIDAASSRCITCHEKENIAVKQVVRDLADEGMLEDTYYVLKKTGIPSGVNVITRQGRAIAIVSTGNSIAGAGEEDTSEIGHSSNIPAPPGGVQRLLWETY